MMDTRRPTAILAALIWLASFLSPDTIAGAQQAAVFGPPDPFPKLTNSQAITDVFVGKNVVGPYVLSYRQIESGSDTVTVNGTRLFRGQDYTLDPKTGVLTFMRPLRTGQIARVDFRSIPGQSIATPPNAPIPFEFKLFGGSNSSLNFNALFRPETNAPLKSGANAASQSGLMLLGFGGKSAIGTQSTLSSKFYFDAHGGNVLGRGGLQLTETSKTSFGQFSGGFSRAGADFKASDQTGIAKGLQIIEAAGSLPPVYGIQASASFKQTTELPTLGKGGTTTVLGQRVAGTLGVLRFQATHSDTTTEGPNLPGRIVAADRLQLDQKLDAKTNATALVERTQTNTRDAGSVAQTSTLSLRSNPTQSVSILGTLQNRLLPTGAEDAATLRVNAEPTKEIKLAATAGERYNSKGALHSREASLDYVPSSRLTLSGLVQVKGEGAQDSVAGGLSANAKPLPYLEVGGGFKLRDTSINGISQTDTPDTYNVRMALAILRNALKVTGGYSANPEDDKGGLARTNSRNVGLESKLGRFDLSGAYALQNELLNPRFNSALDLKLAWRFASASQIITAYKSLLAQDSSLLITDTYSLSLSHRVGSLLDLALSGVMTTYERDGILQPNRDYRAEAKLGLRF